MLRETKMSVFAVLSSEQAYTKNFTLCSRTIWNFYGVIVQHSQRKSKTTLIAKKILNSHWVHVWTETKLHSPQPLISAAFNLQMHKINLNCFQCLHILHIKDRFKPNLLGKVKFRKTSDRNLIITLRTSLSKCTTEGPIILDIYRCINI